MRTPVTSAPMTASCHATTLPLAVKFCIQCAGCKVVVVTVNAALLVGTGWGVTFFAAAPCHSNTPTSTSSPTLIHKPLFRIIIRLKKHYYSITYKTFLRATRSISADIPQ